METSSRPAARSVAGLEPMLSIDELAEYLGKPVRTIYDWRLSGRGPRAVHVGRSLRYRVCDVQAWLDAQLERVPGEFPDPGCESGAEPG
jgi:excisionase family DNA binding protein